MLFAVFVDFLQKLIFLCMVMKHSRAEEEEEKAGHSSIFPGYLFII